jgi:putative transposase
LWEGRFRAALVDPEDALLTCMRYIDSHAQRSGLCAEAADYPWSSCAHHLGRRRDPLIVDHARYWALGNTPFEREGAFRSFLDEGVSQREAQAISQATRRGWPIAGAEGQRRLSTQLGRDIVPRPRGRPRRAEVSPA